MEDRVFLNNVARVTRGQLYLAVLCVLPLFFSFFFFSFSRSRAHPVRVYVVHVVSWLLRCFDRSSREIAFESRGGKKGTVEETESTLSFVNFLFSDNEITKASDRTTNEGTNVLRSICRLKMNLARLRRF